MDERSHNEPHCDDISTLIQAMTLRELRSIETCHMERVIAKLDHLRDLVVSSHRAEMHKIDVETDALAVQLEEVASGMREEEQAELVQRLRGVAKRINAIGKIIPIPET